MPDDEVLAAARSRLGRVLRGKYRLDRVLGAGGMAVVYAATHRNNKQFAIKVLHAELSVRESVRSRFQREGYVANSVKHPGAVAVLDDDVGEDGSAFIVMELLEGSTVDDLWTRHGKRMPLSLVLSIADALLDVLAAAHARGIVHRDLKPPNLFVTREGVLKVLDFGIARLLDDAGGAGTTTSGVTMGTPAYMAPEQVLGKAGEVDARTDLWAVGATMFSLLTGEFVHTGDNATQLMVNAATKGARSMADVAPDVPTAIAAVVDRVLAFEKAERWSSATEMRDALRAASVEATGAAIEPLPKTEEPVAGGAQVGRPKASRTAFAPTVSSEPAPPTPAREKAPPRRGGRWLSARGATVIAVGVIAVSLAVAATLNVRRAGAGPLDVPVISSRPEVEEAFRHAVESLLDADVEGAERGFAQAAAEEPRQPWPHLGLALSYSMEQRFREMQVEVGVARDLVREERRGAARDQELLELLHAFNSPDFADRYARFKAGNPGYLLGLQTLAYFGTDSGTREQRLGRFDDVLAIDRRYPVTYLAESWLFQKLGDSAGARAALDAGLARRVTAPWLLDQRGVLRLAQGDAEGAKDDFREAMSHNGPRQAMVHYALALLRTGKPADEPLRRQQVASMLAIPDPDLRAEVLCQHAMGLYAAGRVAAADQLLGEVLASASSAKAGTTVRCMFPPIWSDLALGRYEVAGRRLGLVAGLLIKPDMTSDELASAQWTFTALRGMLRAETGALPEADADLQALSAPAATEGRQLLAAELEARIQLASARPVRQTPAGASLSWRARAAHLRGRAGERDGDEAGATASYGSLAAMALECARSDIPLVLTCVPYVADGLARLARLHLARGRREEAARVMALLDSIWPEADGDLAPVASLGLVRAALR